MTRRLGWTAISCAAMAVVAAACGGSTSKGNPDGGSRPPDATLEFDAPPSGPDAAPGRFTELVSVATDGTMGDSSSRGNVAISADGRFVVFVSDATNLVAGDTNGVADVYLRDRTMHTLERISVKTDGTEAGGCVGGSDQPSISSDGRFVLFESDCSQLVTGDTNGHSDVYMRDRMMHTTERVSLTSTGGQGTGPAGILGAVGPAMSPDGRFVVFESDYTNLVTGDTNNSMDAFVRDRMMNTTVRASVKNDGTQGTGAGVGEFPAISADGRFVAFESTSADLITGDTNGADDIYVRDLMLGTTERVSVATDGTQADGINFAPDTGRWVSDDGRYVAWVTRATNLFANDTNGNDDIVVRDRMAGTTTPVSVSSAGLLANGSSRRVAITGDGRYLAFDCAANNLTADSTLMDGLYVRDTMAGTTTLVSVGVGGVKQDSIVDYPAISSDGKIVGFMSDATNLVVPNIPGNVEDIYVTTNP